MECVAVAYLRIQHGFSTLSRVHARLQCADRAAVRRARARDGIVGTHHAVTAFAALIFAPMVVLGGVSASAWHGVAFTELATLAGTSRAGTALEIGNTCVFLSLFLTPLAIPPLLSLGSWPMVWAVASLCALNALPIFPRALRNDKAGAALIS